MTARCCAGVCIEGQRHRRLTDPTLVLLWLAGRPFDCSCGLQKWIAHQQIGNLQERQQIVYARGVHAWNHPYCRQSRKSSWLQLRREGLIVERRGSLSAEGPSRGHLLGCWTGANAGLAHPPGGNRPGASTLDFPPENDQRDPPIPTRPSASSRLLAGGALNHFSVR
jgi:hypothetical protein